MSSGEKESGSEIPLSTDILSDLSNEKLDYLLQHIEQNDTKNSPIPGEKSEPIIVQNNKERTIDTDRTDQNIPNYQGVSQLPRVDYQRILIQIEESFGAEIPPRKWSQAQLSSWLSSLLSSTLQTHQDCLASINSKGLTGKSLMTTLERWTMKEIMNETCQEKMQQNEGFHVGTSDEHIQRRNACFSNMADLLGLKSYPVIVKRIVKELESANSRHIDRIQNAQSCAAERHQSNVNTVEDIQELVRKCLETVENVSLPTASTSQPDVSHKGIDARRISLNNPVFHEFANARRKSVLTPWEIEQTHKPSVMSVPRPIINKQEEEQMRLRKSILAANALEESSKEECKSFTKSEDTNLYGMHRPSEMAAGMALMKTNAEIMDILEEEEETEEDGLSKSGHIVGKALYPNAPIQQMGGRNRKNSNQDSDEGSENEDEEKDDDDKDEDEDDKEDDENEDEDDKEDDENHKEERMHGNQYVNHSLSSLLGKHSNPVGVVNDSKTSLTKPTEKPTEKTHVNFENTNRPKDKSSPGFSTIGHFRRLGSTLSGAAGSVAHSVTQAMGLSNKQKENSDEMERELEYIRNRKRKSQWFQMFSSDGEENTPQRRQVTLVKQVQTELALKRLRKNSRIIIETVS